MAGLGAMFIGMIGGGIAWLLFIMMTLMLVVIIIIDAHRHKMNAILWGVMALLFNFYSLPFYIFARIKSSVAKCGSCGTKIGYKYNFCPACGAEAQKFDDGAFAKKVLKIVLIVAAVFSGISVAWVALTGILDF